MSWQVRWFSIAAIPMAVFSGATIIYFYRYVHKFQLFAATATLFSILAILFVFITSFLAVYGQGNVSNATPQFLNASGWLRNNTPSTSKIMTDWMDGSLVEALANRTSFSDSVDTGQRNGNTTPVIRIYNFSKFLFAGARNFSFLNSTRPDYLLVRRGWNPVFIHAFEDEANVGNVSLGATNIYLLLNESAPTINGNGANLVRVYKNNDTIIYRVMDNSS
jgi:hypothetical protein